MTAWHHHPLASVLADAVDGRFPAVDGVVDVVAPDAWGTHAVVEFTGHALVLTDLPREDELLGAAHGFGGATDPRLLVHLARDGDIGSLDLVLVRRAGPAAVPALPLTDRYDDHPRVQRARRHRRDVRVFGDERGVVCIGAGLVGRTEVSVELTGGPRGSAGALVLGALAHVPPADPVFAQVSPGNAASVRTFLALGFTPIGAEVLLDPHRCSAI